MRLPVFHGDEQTLSPVVTRCDNRALLKAFVLSVHRNTNLLRRQASLNIFSPVTPFYMEAMKNRDPGGADLCDPAP